MKLALRELIRRPSRFATATAILTLISLLLMFLGGLLDGLIGSSTGAVRAQNADVFVFSSESRASFLRSRIDADTRASITDSLESDAEVSGLGVVLLGARVPGNDPRDLASVAVWGYETSTSRLPTPPEPGHAYADRLLEADGVEMGDELLLGPARTPVIVSGWVEDTAFNGQAGLWADVDTWRSVLDANRPGAALAPDVVQALIVTGVADVDASIEAIESSVGGVVVAFTETETIDEIPGVAAQRTTFNQIIGVTVVIALVVIALFFSLLTVERTALYGVLKAIGARSGTLFAGLAVQAVVVTLVAAAIAGFVVVVIASLIPPGSIPLAVSASRVVSSVVLMIVAGLIGSAFSLRRVLRVDPASALGGA